MQLNQLIIPLLLIIQVVNGAIMLWSTKKIEIPALKPFNNDDFHALLKDLNNPKLIAFTSPSLGAARTLHHFLSDKNTAYVPAATLHDDEERDIGIIDQILSGQTNKNDNLMVVLLVNTEFDRVKRAAAASAASNASEISYRDESESSGPVVYSAPSRSDEDVGAMIYSSKPPLLNDNGTMIELGEATHASMDERGSFTRLVVTIPVENGKIVLRFRFLLASGYWSMASVEVVKQTEITDHFNLTINQEVTAPLRFSYHCGGFVKFDDPKNDLELYLYDVQVQVDTYKHRFSDAYNCVPFITGPIWSGIFVTFILCIGLVVGLSALSSIKTMDKFDNQKTKQLSITVWE